MKKYILALGLLALISISSGAALACDYDGPADVTIKVDGLVCDACARSIEKVFLKHDGVTALDINLDTKTVTVDMAKGKTLSDADIQKMIYYAGYKVADVKRPC